MLSVLKNFDMGTLDKLQEAIVVNHLGEEMMLILTTQNVRDTLLEGTNCSNYFEALQVLYKRYFLRSLDSRAITYYLQQNQYDIIFKVMANINIEELSREEITNNPYLQNVKFNKATSGSMNYIPGGLLYAKDIQEIEKRRRGSEREDMRFIVPNTIGPYNENTYSNPDNPYLFRFHYYKYSVPDNQDFSAPLIAFPFLLDKSLTNVNRSGYMSVEPYEINTLSEFLTKANGNILMCGCGLGYAAYMAGLKENVTGITILELNSDVINLFQSQVQSQLPKKVDIVHCDAYEFLEREDLSNYDCVYVDTWYCTNDMIIPYLRCLLLEEKYPNTKFIYWIEASLLQEIKECLLEHIWTAATGYSIEGIGDGNVSQIAKKIIENSNEVIDSAQKLNSFISDESIRQHLRALAKKYEGNMGTILPVKNAAKVNNKGQLVKKYGDN